MRLFRIFLGVLITVLLLMLLAVGGLVIALNTGAGRAFAEREINHFFAPQVSVAGLAGHFPADIKLASLSLADSGGVWLSGQSLELRWQPLALLRGGIDVTSLTAASLDIPRQPVAGTQSKNSWGVLQGLRIDVARVAIPALNLGAAFAGENTSLNVTGAMHFRNVTHGSITLNATALNGGAGYSLNAGIDPRTVSMQLHAAEPPDGPLGHFAGPLVHQPLTLDITLAGPRDAAALNFNMALGAAHLNGNGTLGLNPDSPKADVVLNVPALAPFGAMAGNNLAGSTSLHLVIAMQPDGGSTLALSGDAALTAGPYGLEKLGGPAGHFELLANVRRQVFTIQNFEVSGAAFEASASGSVAPAGMNLRTQISLHRLGAFLPGTSGDVTGSGNITGMPGDFAVQALLTGSVAEKAIPSAPFSIVIGAQHLPLAPVGTLTGSGEFEHSPLQLDAALSRDVNGAATLTINKALWRSLKAQADLVLAPGATVPTGTANFMVGRLGDFARFSPVPLQGSLAGSFAYSGKNIFKLDVTAKNLVAGPSPGAVNATLSANGPANALAVRVQGSADRLSSAPARMALAGVVNLETRAATVSSFSASWRQVDAVLQGPAQILTRPAITVRHLALGLNGGRIGLDGTLAPELKATLTVQNLPASLAVLFAPKLDMTGTLSASAALTGTLGAPIGNITLNAQNIKLRSGPASAMPAADLTGSAEVSGKAANVNATLTAGQDVALTAAGLVPLSADGPLNLHVTGRTDLRLLDLFVAGNETEVRGLVTADVMVTGTTVAPRVDGDATLDDGSVQDIGNGLNLTHMTARMQAAGPMITLQSFQATAGDGRITGHGTIDLGTPGFPLDIALDAANATPISSDIFSGNLDAALTLKGALRGQMALAGTVNIGKANINIPKSLPPSVADLPIINAGEKLPPPPSPLPAVLLDLLVTAKNQIFVRGDGIFAELGGRVHLTGTMAAPDPEGGFELIRGNVSLAGKNLQFTKGNVSFNGAAFMPTLDLEASAVTADNTTATLIVGGTAAKPEITLTSSPPLPSDEILARLLFGQSTTSLSPFQTASLAAALAQLSGLGGGLPNPLDSVRNALGLSELSLSGSGSGPPSVAAGRYVAPGVYVGATQATNGQGTQATVEINLYKGLKLQTSTGTSSTGNSSSVGLTYQFNY